VRPAISPILSATPRRVFEALVEGVAAGEFEALPRLYAEQARVAHPFDPWRRPALRGRSGVAERRVTTPTRLPGRGPTAPWGRCSPKRRGRAAPADLGLTRGRRRPELRTPFGRAGARAFPRQPKPEPREVLAEVQLIRGRVGTGVPRKAGKSPCRARYSRRKESRTRAADDVRRPSARGRATECRLRRRGWRGVGPRVGREATATCRSPRVEPRDAERLHARAPCRSAAGQHGCERPGRFVQDTDVAAAW
jgi:hypothetical protein